MAEDIVGRALAFAAQAHAGQHRKGSAVPYIVHPAEVTAICARLTSDAETIAAAALHDVVEDTQRTLEDIRGEFGDRVAGIVAAESEDKQRDLPAGATWHERKLETVRRISATDDIDVLRVCLADKLSNMRSIREDHLALGDALWSRFNMSDPAEHAWYYRSLADALAPALGDTCAWHELDALIDEVFGEA